jgi:hypothetical protein
MVVVLRAHEMKVTSSVVKTILHQDLKSERAFRKILAEEQT